MDFLISGNLQRAASCFAFSAIMLGSVCLIFADVQDSMDDYLCRYGRRASFVPEVQCPHFVKDAERKMPVIAIRVSFPGGLCIGPVADFSFWSGRSFRWTGRPLACVTFALSSTVVIVLERACCASCAARAFR